MQSSVQGTTTGPTAWTSWTTTELLDEIHPGKIVLEDFMKPLSINVSLPQRIQRIESRQKAKKQASSPVLIKKSAMNLIQ